MRHKHFSVILLWKTFHCAWRWRGWRGLLFESALADRAAHILLLRSPRGWSLWFTQTNNSVQSWDSAVVSCGIFWMCVAKRWGWIYIRMKKQSASPHLCSHYHNFDSALLFSVTLIPLCASQLYRSLGCFFPPFAYLSFYYFTYLALFSLPAISLSWKFCHTA